MKSLESLAILCGLVLLLAGGCHNSSSYVVLSSQVETQTLLRIQRFRQFHSIRLDDEIVIALLDRYLGKRLRISRDVEIRHTEHGPDRNHVLYHIQPNGLIDSLAEFSEGTWVRSEKYSYKSSRMEIVHEWPLHGTAPPEAQHSQNGTITERQCWHIKSAHQWIHVVMEPCSASSSQENPDREEYYYWFDPVETDWAVYQPRRSLISLFANPDVLSISQYHIDHFEPNDDPIAEGSFVSYRRFGPHLEHSFEGPLSFICLQPMIHDEGSSSSQEYSYVSCEPLPTPSDDRSIWKPMRFNVADDPRALRSTVIVQSSDSVLTIRSTGYLGERITTWKVLGE